MMTRTLREPLKFVVARRLHHAIVSSVLLIVLLPLQFVQQPMMLLSDPEIQAQPGRPNRHMTEGERRALHAVLDYRFCPAGPTVVEVLETAQSRRWPGGISWPSGSFAVESQAYPGSFSVYVPYRIGGSPDPSEVTWVLGYHAESGAVAGAMLVERSAMSVYEDAHPIDFPGMSGLSCRG
jgi:hypothetical protein